MVKIFKRSNGKLYIEYMAYGKKTQRSTGLVDNTRNRSFVKKEVIPRIEAKIRNGDFDSGKPQNFSHYSEIYLREKKLHKTYTKIKMQTGVVCIFFGDMRIDKIKKSDVKEWVSDRLDINTPKTVRNYLSVIRGIIGEAIDSEAIAKNVAYGIKLPTHIKKEIEPFTPGEVGMLLNNATGSLKLFLAISFYTGLRTSEVLSLNPRDIELENRIIHVRKSISDGHISTTKTTDSIRKVPILDDLMPYLLEIKSKGWLFSKKNGDHYAALPGHYNRAWIDLLQENNIEYRKIYGTRHTFIVSMLKNSDLSIMEIAQLAGHATTKMIIENYGIFIKGEQLLLNKSLKLFADKSADSVA